MQSELSNLEFFIKRQTAESYWKVGKFIHEHLLENKKRAGYGESLYERLSKDVGKDASTLSKTVRFYRTYPILDRGPKLSWTHYRKLITVKDQKERKKLEAQIVQKNWDGQKLQNYLNTKRELETGKDDRKPIAQLKLTRGRPDVFEVIKSDDAGADSELILDYGFRVTCALPPAVGFKPKEGDFVQLNRDSKRPTITKADVKKDEIYTYEARVKKVIDGDTLLVKIDIDFGISIRQKLRLRGIDCPEMDTDEGKAAKKFVEDRLKGLDFIIIKTFKDSTDKYDRYLADVFYGEEQEFLNQELLNERLAMVY
ncbi:MAG: DUF1016 N-terminal domain-containing protein [Candidatus Omnitrophota bacterium]